VSQYQKGKTNLDFTEARDSEWQWHQLGQMQVCTSLQAYNHTSTPPLSFSTAQMPFLPPNQQHLSTEGIQHIHYRRIIFNLHFLQIPPTTATLFFFRTDYMDSPDCLQTLLSKSFFHFLVVGTVLCIQRSDTVGWASGRACSL